tara:strand:+ start:1153 stop:1380 length:228 start_codon:yes stop_codon:yes gene_type:complete
VQVSEYIVQQSAEFNERVNETQKLISDLRDRLLAIEYNIERLEHTVQVLVDSMPLVLPEHKEGEVAVYEKYLKKS